MKKTGWRRGAYLACGVAVAALGLGSRRYDAQLPGFIAAYAGDTLWALLVFLIVAFVAPQSRLGQRTTTALGLSYAVEISQLYHAPWIDAVRHTRVGGLVLGFGFLWSDMVCYSVGVGLGTLGDYVIQHAAKVRTSATADADPARSASNTRPS